MNLKKEFRGLLDRALDVARKAAHGLTNKFANEAAADPEVRALASKIVDKVAGPVASGALGSLMNEIPAVKPPLSLYDRLEGPNGIR